jgi:phage/plasmid-like protein (TIGR03299 family)
MPHELEIGDDGVARMFYAGQVPWHGLGRGVETAQTSAQAIKLAGLGGWNVHMERFAPESAIRAWVESRSTDLATMNWAEEWKAIARGMDNRTLGVATDAYKPIANERMFDFMDSLVKDRIFHYAAAGSLMGGRKVWILAQMESDMRVGDDVYHRFLLLVAGHDNFTSLKVYGTDVRVICNNTLLQATRQAQAAVRIVHSGDTDRKFDTAREVLRITTDDQRRMQEWLDRLAAKKITEEQVIVVRDACFGSLDDDTATRRRQAIETWMAVYEAEKEREGRTGYCALQTVTGYGDHLVSLRKREDGEEHLRSVLGGTGAQFKKKGIIAVANVTKLPAPQSLVASSD